MGDRIPDGIVENLVSSRGDIQLFFTIILNTVVFEDSVLVEYIKASFTVAKNTIS